MPRGLFRLPFVFAKQWGIASVAMILGEPIEQTRYSALAQVLGWLYHFSNGVTFGVMYVAMIGDCTRRHWTRAVVFAVGLDLGMLFTPYPQVFNIAVTGRFVIITLAAHAIFGAAPGLAVRSLARLYHPGAARWNQPA